MPVTVHAQIMRCCIIFEARVRGAENIRYLILVLDQDGAKTWFGLDKTPLRQIADLVEMTARTLRVEDLEEDANLRHTLFARDAEILADARLPDESSIKLIEKWRLGRFGEDGVFLEFLVENKWWPFVLDIVCATNLFIQIKDALNVNFHSGSGTVN
ncbi:hypothetical protein AFEL58S_01867 [Afipia felis]